MHAFPHSEHRLLHVHHTAPPLRFHHDRSHPLTWQHTCQHTRTSTRTSTRIQKLTCLTCLAVPRLTTRSLLRSRTIRLGFDEQSGDVVLVLVGSPVLRTFERVTCAAEAMQLLEAFPASNYPSPSNDRQTWRCLGFHEEMRGGTWKYKFQVRWQNGIVNMVDYWTLNLNVVCSIRAWRHAP